MEREYIDDDHYIDWPANDVIGILYERDGERSFRSLGGVPKNYLYVKNWFYVQELIKKKGNKLQ